MKFKKSEDLTAVYNAYYKFIEYIFLRGNKYTYIDL